MQSKAFLARNRTHFHQTFIHSGDAWVHTLLAFFCILLSHLVVLSFEDCLHVSFTTADVLIELQAGVVQTRLFPSKSVYFVALLGGHLCVLTTIF